MDTLSSQLKVRYSFILPSFYHWSYWRFRRLRLPSHTRTVRTISRTIILDNSPITIEVSRLWAPKSIHTRASWTSYRTLHSPMGRMPGQALTTPPTPYRQLVVKDSFSSFLFMLIISYILHSQMRGMPFSFTAKIYLTHQTQIQNRGAQISIICYQLADDVRIHNERCITLMKEVTTPGSCIVRFKIPRIPRDASWRTGFYHKRNANTLVWHPNFIG